MNRPIAWAAQPDASRSCHRYLRHDRLAGEERAGIATAALARSGKSYDGFTVAMSLIDPHPALKAAVPMMPMVDGWMGDDWFHNGAFRQDQSIDYIYGQEAATAATANLAGHRYDDYENFCASGSAGDLRARAWASISSASGTSSPQHPAYDAYWQEQAVDQILANQPLQVPTLWSSAACGTRRTSTARSSLSRAWRQRHQQRHAIWCSGRGGTAARSRRREHRPVAVRRRHGALVPPHVMIPFLDAHLKDDGPAPTSRR